MLSLIFDLIHFVTYLAMLFIFLSGLKTIRSQKSKIELLETALKDISARETFSEESDLVREEADDIRAVNRKLISDVRWMRSRVDSALDHIKELGL